jgi:hypothetical protein
MSPPGVGYNAYVYETSPKYGLLTSWSDNGAPPSGGDCLVLHHITEDLGTVTYVVQAAIGGATAQVTITVTVYGTL